jgi:hypothetical protein
MLRQGVSVTARGLNFSGDQKARVLEQSRSGLHQGVSEAGKEGDDEVERDAAAGGDSDHAEGARDVVYEDLAKRVHDLHVRGVERKGVMADSWREMKERMSFGTNLSDHDSHEDEPKGMIKTPNMLTVEKFLARNLDGKGGLNPGQVPTPRRSIEKP